MCAAYGDDLVHIHQSGHNTLALAAARTLLEALARDGVTKGRIVDLGCGSGELLAEVTEAGFKGYGIDASPSFTKRAKKTAPKAKFETAFVHEAKIPDAVAVTAIGEVFNYVPAGREKPPKLKPVFRRVAKALPQGGHFLFDVIMATGTPSDLSGRLWRASDDGEQVPGEDWAVMVDAHEDKEKQLLTRDITSFRARGKGYRRTRERHIQYLYRKEELVPLLEEAGFRVTMLKSYGTHPLLPRRLAFHAVTL